MGKRTRSDICKQLGIPVWQWIALMSAGLLMKPVFFMLASLIKLRHDVPSWSEKPVPIPPRPVPANDPRGPIVLAQAPH